jgi:hypothetical protein
MSWERGRGTVLDLIDKGELTKVVADLDPAHRMLYQANQHVRSVNTLASDDPYAAYSLIHDAIRKALAAMLQAQGLRATTAGGHLAVQYAIFAQFEPTMGRLLRSLNRIRTMRHAAEYPTESTYVDEDIVRDDLPHAAKIVAAAEAALEHLPVFTE